VSILEGLTFEELDHHAMERLVFGTDEISPILKGHIFVEKILETLLSRNLENPQALFKSRRSFELKLDLARAMGLINEKYYSSFKAFNNIRNNYSHTHDYEVSFAELNGFKFDWEDIQNQAYAKASEKGVAEAAGIAVIFLCWKAIWLIQKPE